VSEARWRVDELGLEEIVLAYLGRRAAPPIQVEPYREAAVS
jgi:hypothetical protein